MQQILAGEDLTCRQSPRAAQLQHGALDEDQQSPRSAHALALQLVEGDAGRKLVAAVITGLAIAAHSLRSETVLSAAGTSLRAAAVAVESPTLAATTARGLRIAAQALENPQVTGSLAASMDLTARTLETEAVGQGVSAAISAADAAMTRCLSLASAALQNQQIVAGAAASADLVARATQHETVKAVFEHPIVSATMSRTADLARLTLQNQTVQRLGMASIDVATRVMANERVQALGAAGAQITATVVNAAVRNETLTTAVSGAVGLTSRIYQALPSAQRPHAELAQEVSARLSHAPDAAAASNPCIHELLASRPEAREALLQMYYELQNRLADEENRRRAAEAHAAELAEVLAAGVMSSPYYCKEAHSG